MEIKIFPNQYLKPTYKFFNKYYDFEQITLYLGDNFLYSINKNNFPM